MAHEWEGSEGQGWATQIEQASSKAAWNCCNFIIPVQESSGALDIWVIYYARKIEAEEYIDKYI
jgi:hypothetical protein